LSSGMNSMSAQLVEDFIKPRFKGISDAKFTNIAKISGRINTNIIATEWNY